MGADAVEDGVKYSSCRVELKMVAKNGGIRVGRELEAGESAIEFL